MSARRIGLGVLANIFDKLAIAAVQLSLVPVLATHWGLKVYGSWLVLSTIPAFLGVSDFGFGGAAGTRMAMLVAKGDRAEALEVFQTASAVTFASSATLVALALALLWAIPPSTLPATGDFGPAEARGTLGLLLLYGVAALQGGLSIAAFRSDRHFALAAVLAGATVVAENLAVVAAVVAGGRPFTAAATLLIARLLCLSGQAALVRWRLPWVRFGFRDARREEVRLLLPLALATMMVPLSQAVFLQGTALMLSIAASAVAVPAFTAGRTLSRIGLQFTQLLNTALIPEYSAAVARDDRSAQATMVAVTLLASAVVLAPFAAVLVIWGPEVMALWTHGLIRPARGLMIAFAATVVLGGIWNPLSNLILAMNRHAGFVYPFAILAAVTMPVCYGLSRWLGSAGAAWSIALLDAAMCGVIVRQGLRLFPSAGEVTGAAMRIGTRLRLMRHHFSEERSRRT